MRNKNWMRGKRERKEKRKCFGCNWQEKKERKQRETMTGRRERKKRREDEERGKGDEEGWMMFRGSEGLSEESSGMIDAVANLGCRGRVTKRVVW